MATYERNKNISLINVKETLRSSSKDHYTIFFRKISFGYPINLCGESIFLKGPWREIVFFYHPSVWEDDTGPNLGNFGRKSR
jgi:hypothetical protein